MSFDVITSLRMKSIACARIYKNIKKKKHPVTMQMLKPLSGKLKSIFRKLKTACNRFSLALRVISVEERMKGAITQP